MGQTADGQAVLMSPDALSKMVDRACGSRPTVVILSACFSGVFLKPVSDANRAVFTAARSDRTSFGCGESDRYPYFDDCFLKNFSHAHDFIELGREVQACVAEREVETGMSPPSEPQLSVGSGLRPVLPLYPLAADSRSPTAF